MKKLIAAVLLSVTALAAQEFRATITGTITDQQGAVVPGATIEVKNLETTVLTSAKSNESGIFVVPFLPPGNYAVTVNAAGFKRIVREAVELRVGDRLRLDFRLEVGALAEQVTVAASADLLETTTASKGQVIDAAKVSDLPLLGRNPFMLAAVSTGVQYVPALASRSNRPFDNGGMDSFAINGGRQFTNEFLLDGVPDTNTETTQPSNLSFVPSPDATEEFKVQTNTYDAQYGRTGGGVINVSLKSGTNRLHGSLYDYFRHDKLNANPFEANLAGSGKAKFRWSQPGLQFNGPVWIPKVYDGRNRTFFMFSWEKIKSAIPFPQTYTVPTAEQRDGDFSRTVQANGQPITLYDPLTTTQSGSTFTRQTFAGNRIPAARINPVSAKILNYIPKPNAAGNAQGFFNLISSPNPRTDEYDQFVGRVDQVINAKHRFFSRYVRGNRHEMNSDAGFPHEASPWYGHWRINQGGNFDLTSALTPTVVVSSRVGYIRHQFAIAQFGSGFDATQLGLPASLISQLPVKFFPRISYTDYTQFGPPRSIGNELTFSDTWSWSETINQVIGRHALKFGTEFRVMRNNQQLPSSSLGDFAFTKAFTQRNPLTGDAGSGNAFASLLLGSPASGSVPMNANPAYQSRYFVLFVQDDWRVTSKLTLNLGLRWDYESPLSERFHRQNAGFDSAAANPFRVPGLQLKGGLLFTGSDQSLPFARDWNNLQPRIGVAYQLTQRTVLRGGYGISYLPTFDTGFNNGFSVSTPYVASVDGGLRPANNLSNPYPDGLRRPAGSSQGLATLVGQGFNYGFRERTIPYVHQWSIGFQHELPWRILVDASYVGSRSRNLQTGKGINEISAADMAQGSAYLLAQVTNPFQGLLPGTAFNGATVPRQQLLRPFPQFTGITQSRHTIGQSWYDSLQLRVEKRLSHGVHLLGSYTFGKSIEAIDYLNAQDNFGSLAKVLTGVDSPHRFVISGGWELPFGKGSRGLVRALIGGWALNGIATFQSGLPIGAPGGAYSTGVNPNLPEGTQSRNRWFNTCTINLNGARQNCASASEPVAWLVQPAFTLRTLSTRFPNLRTRRPGLLDFSVFKSFWITEAVRLEFRAESFNLTNTPWFGGPATGINASNFGVVSPSQANDPRNVQLALRLTF
jgi:hypothetical protein